MSLRSLLALVAALALLATACADDATDEATDEADDNTAATTTTTGATTTTTAPAASGSACEAPEYTVAVPSGWHANDVGDERPCRWFHPEDFELPEATEATSIAIHFEIVGGTFPALVRDLTEGSGTGEVVSEEEETVDERRAIRVESVSSGEALLPEGTRVVTWVVDTPSGILIANTTSLAEGDFEEHVDVLDRMMASLEIESPGERAERACSASGLPPQPREQPELSAPVRDIRDDIATLAVECDFDGLAELAQRGEREFTASFGGAEDLAAFWRRQEADRGEPMRFLRQLLDRPFAAVEETDPRQLVWPSAFGYDSWDEVPEADREALRPLYGDEDFDGFAEFGGYVGYRIGITEAGDWLFFVRGD